MLKNMIFTLFIATALFWISEAMAQPVLQGPSVDYFCNPVQNVAMPAAESDGVHCKDGGAEISRDDTASDHEDAFTAHATCIDPTTGAEAQMTFFVRFEQHNWEAMYLQFLASLLGNKKFLVTGTPASSNPECTEGTKKMRRAYSAVLTAAEPVPSP